MKTGIWKMLWRNNKSNQIKFINSRSTGK